ncbi:hypothetical protein ACETK8_15945 [Brevundimonas staleyi]|uniref:Tyr recombinase domain-containing protein n=1 Tax=Brevundimonas staleyi TaxID=74326 RepID=A0ABW0FYS4_9CAUL
MARKPAKRRQRPHGVLPVGFDWRDGRPRWLPSPTRRAQGWKPCDFVVRSPRSGAVWLSKGDAIARAEAINAAVAAWTLKGTPVPADMAAFAPPGAHDGTALTPQQKLDRRAIGALIDEWLRTPKFTLPRGQGGLAATTVADYRSKIHVFQQALVEGEDEKALAQLRALPIETLAAPEEEADDDFAVEDAYQWLLANRGHNMAHGVTQVASVFFGWLKTKKRMAAFAINPVALIDRTPPAGRIRVGTPEEMAALVASADALGLPSIGDSVLLALDLGWSLKDILALDKRRLVKLPDGTGAQAWHVARVSRAKTGVASSEIPLLAIGSAAVDRIFARHAGRAVSPTRLIVREDSPRNRSGVWTNNAFNKAWRQVRDHAAATAPSLLTGDGDEGSDFNGAFDFMDTRDTFITLARSAGLEASEVCKRSLHKDEAHVLRLWAKHYGTGNAAVGRSGARKMSAHLEASGWVKALVSG